LLRRFTKDGWVTKKAVAGQRGQTRQQYALTALGRKTLIERLSQFGPQDAGSFPGFMTRVGMFQILSFSARERILEQREGYLLQREQQFATLAEKIELEGYSAEVVVYLRKQLESELTWIRHLQRLSKS
jgi:DNA-binding PadR family transcriptional regulator